MDDQKTSEAQATDLVQVNPLSIKNALCYESGVLRIENLQQVKDKSIDNMDEVIEAQVAGTSGA